MVAPRKPVVVIPTGEEQTVGPRTDAGFNFQKFTDLWQKGDDLRTERQTAEMEALANKQDADKEILTLQDQSLQTKKKFVTDIQPLVGELTQVEAARKRQTELQSSGSFVDQLQAMQDAMLNPRLATTDGRARMRAEINASMSTLATVNAAEQDVIGAQMDSVKLGLGVKNAKYDTARTREAQHLEVLAAEQARVDAIYKGMETTQAARELVLNDMSRDDLIKAKDEALKAGKANVNGFDLPGHTLDQELAKRDNATYEWEIKKLALDNRNDQLEERAQNRLAMTLTKTQLQTLITGGTAKIQTQDGPQIVDGQFFKMHIMKGALDLKTQVENDQIKESADRVMFGDLSQDTVIPGYKRYDVLSKKLPPGSQAQLLAERRKNEYIRIQGEMNNAREIMSKNPNDEQKSLFNKTTAQWGERLANEQKEDDKIISGQALKDARGDKELASIYESNYRGEAADPTVVRNIVQKRIVAAMDAGDILPPELNKAVKTIYADKLSKARAANQLTDDGINDAERKKMIAMEALDEAVVQQARPATDSFLGSQAILNTATNANLTNNPVAQLRDVNGDKIFKTPEQFITIIKQADVAAEKMLDSDPNIGWTTPAEREQLRAGKSVTNKDGRTLTPEMFKATARVNQDTAFLIALEERHAGLADRYVKWWAEEGATYADTFTKNQLESVLGSGTPQTNAMQTLMSTTIEQSIQNYRQGIINSADVFKDEQQKRRREWVSYDNDPANRQAALLQFNPQLSDKERATVFTGLIKPIIMKGQKAKAAYEDINIAIEDAIGNPESIPGYKENPELKKALSKVQQNRGEIVRQMEALTDSPWLYGNDKKVSESIWSRISAGNKKTANVDMGMVGTFGMIPSLPEGERQKSSANIGTFEGVDGFLKRETGTRPYDWYRNLMGGETPQEPANSDEAPQELPAAKSSWLDGLGIGNPFKLKMRD